VERHCNEIDNKPQVRLAAAANVRAIHVFSVPEYIEEQQDVHTVLWQLERFLASKSFVRDNCYRSTLALP
jgi:hypothetical protein